MSEPVTVITLSREMSRRTLEMIEPHMRCVLLYGPGIALAVVGIGVLIAGHTPLSRAIVAAYMELERKP